jgi:xanthine dehydrogenase accessory factor
VENAVIQEAEAVLQDGEPRQLCYGISDEMGWDVGLACGGQIDIFVHRADPDVWAALAGALGGAEPAVLLTVIGGKVALGRQAVVRTAGVIPADFPFPGAIAAAEPCLSGRSGNDDATVLRLPSGAEVLVEPLLPPPHLIIVGAVHPAIPLVRMAKALGFRVTIVDPRSRFANRERFPEADQIVVEWPQEAMAQLGIDGRSAIAILTHDPKIDDPALTAALNTGAFYVGAIGSRGTHAQRVERLERLGMTAEQIQRVHSPIGLDVGGRSPEEMALSILAEMIAVRNGRRGGLMSAEARAPAAN